MRNLLADRGTRLAAVLSLVAVSVLGFSVAPASATDNLVKFTTTTPQQCPTTAEPRNVCATMSGTWAPTTAGYSWDEIHPDADGMGFRVCYKDMNNSYSFPTCWYPDQSSINWLTQTVNLANFGQFTFPVSTGACNTTIFDAARCTYFVQFRIGGPSQAETAGTWQVRLRYGTTSLATADWVCPANGGDCVAPGGTLPTPVTPEEVPEGECGTLDVGCAIGKLADTIQGFFVPDLDLLQNKLDDLSDAFMGSPLGAGVTMVRTWLTLCIPGNAVVATQCWASATPERQLEIPQIDEAQLAASGLQQFGVMSFSYPNHATQPACVGPIIKIPTSSVMNDLPDEVRAAYASTGDAFTNDKLLAPFRACDGHTREVADMARNFLSGILYVGFAWFLANSILGMFGMNPPPPSGGSGAMGQSGLLRAPARKELE